MAHGAAPPVAPELEEAACGGAPAAAQACVDDSVRCRLSGICEGGPLDCGAAAAAEATHGADAAAADDARLACTIGDAERAAAVLAATRHAWDGYRRCAWAEDELQPLSCTGVHWLNLSLTLVDSLDTLHLLGMRREFEEAAEWLADRLDVSAPGEVNLFETTIRILGGLLSAQALAADTHPSLAGRLAAKAAELGARLLPAFDSPSGVPFSDVNLRTGEASMPAWGQISSLSEISSVSLEFTYLARITGHAAFERAPLAVHDRLEAAAAAGGGLLGQFFNPLTGKASGKHGSTITLGARSDSYYEYLLKQWLLTGKTEGWLRDRYVQAMHSVRSRLLQRTAPVGQSGLWYVAEQHKGGGLSGKMDHLVCFLPGVLALGDFHGVSTRLAPAPAAAAAGGEAAGQQEADVPAEQEEEEQEEQEQEAEAGSGADEHSAVGMPDLRLAGELALTCYEMYRRTPTGLAPEIAHFTDHSDLQDFPNRHVHDVGHGDFSIKPKDAHNLLRPESVESFYLLWKVTGDPRYKDWAWQVFRALEKWARLRPSDRHRLCATCQAAAAQSAAEEAAAAAQAAAEAAAVAAAEELAEAARDGGEASTEAAEQPRADVGEQQLQQPRQEPQQEQESGAGTVAGCPACSEAGGYSSLESVLEVPPVRRDKMESFFLAETLKYLYLTFAEPPDRCLHPSCAAADGGGQRLPASQEQAGQQSGQQAGRRALLPLDRYVFTTEAHPLPLVGPAAASWVPPSLRPEPRLLHPFGEPEAGEEAGGLEAQAAGGGRGGSDERATGSAAPAAGDDAPPQQQEAEAVLDAAARALQGGTQKAGELEAALGEVLGQLADAAAAAFGGGGQTAGHAPGDGAAASRAAAAASEAESASELR